MATVGDVAAYILEKQGPMTAMKLQKLCYYSQAWHLAWTDEALFQDRIEAWANGPVAPALYGQHRGKFQVTRETITGDPTAISPDERESIDIVVDAYADRNSFELSQMTHNEDPWKDARGDLPPAAWSNATITHEAMAEYYQALAAARQR